MFQIPDCLSPPSQAVEDVVEVGQKLEGVLSWEEQAKTFSSKPGRLAGHPEKDVRDLRERTTS